MINKKIKIYVLSSILPMVCMLIAWKFMNAFPFGNRTQMAVDFGQQYIGLYGFLRDVVITGDYTALFYSFSKSLGGAMIGVWGFNLISPFNILYILIPKESYSWAIFLTILLRYGATGFAFAFFIIKRYSGLEYKTLYVPIFSLSYALSGMIVSYQMNPIFYDAMIMLPIVLAYLEEFLDGGKPYKYIISLSLTILFHFYMGYMICIFIALYSVFYYLPNKIVDSSGSILKKELIIKLIRLFIYSVLAIGLVFVILLPIIMNLVITKGAYESNLIFKFALQINPLDILSKLMIGGFDNSGWLTGPNLPNIYTGSIALIGVIYYFFNKNIDRIKKIGSGIILLIFFLSFVNEFFNKLWHMGQNPAGFFYRFSWITSFFIVLLAYQSFTKKDNYSKIVNFSVVVVLIASSVYVYFNDYSHIAKNMGNKLSRIIDNYNVLLVLLFLVVTIFLIKKIINKKNINNKIRIILILFTIALSIIFYLLLVKGYLLTQVILTLLVWLLAILFYNIKANKIILLLATLILSLEMSYNVYLSQKSISNDNSPKFSDATKSINELVQKIKEYDPDEFYRIGGTFLYSKNDPFFHNYKGLSAFTSNLEKSTVDLFNYLGDRGGNAATYYANGTPLTDDLFSVKYFLYTKPYSKEESKKYPNKRYFLPLSTRTDLEYRYENIYENDRYIIYKRDNVLPLAFGISSDILNVKLEKNKPYDNQNRILSAIGKKDEYFEHIGVRTVSLENMIQKEENNKLIYEKIDDSNPGFVNLNLEIVDNNTHYFVAPYSFRKLKEKSEVKLDDKIYRYSSGFTQYQLWNVATNNAGKILQMKISNDNEKTIDLTGLNLYKINNDKVDSVIFERRKQGMIMEKWHNNEVSGTINISDSSNLVFTTIPYNEGWQVKVDGKEVKKEKILDSLLAFHITKGEHKIEMKFIPQGLILGSIISTISFIILLFIRYIDKKYNKILI